MRSAFLIALFSAAYSFGFAQCTPDTTFSELYYSETGDELPPARISFDYEAIIHIQVPKDTSFFGQTVAIDSGIISDIDGLPTGIEYECDRPTCSYPGGSYGCIRIFGLPTDSTEVGINQLDMTLEVYSSIFSGPQQIDEFSIELLDRYPASIDEFAQESVNIVPSSNPMTEFSALDIQLADNSNYHLAIYSLTGSVITEIRGSSNSSINERIPIRPFDLPAGIYFAKLDQGGNSKSVRFVVR